MTSIDRTVPPLAILALLCCCLAGCSDGMATVSGTVTFQGQPLDSGRVGFFKPGQAMALGSIRSDGSYELAVGGSSRLQPGSYVVTVVSYDITESPGGKNPPSAKLRIPRRYANRQLSDLTAEVQPGSNTFQFDLTDGT